MPGLLPVGLFPEGNKPENFIGFFAFAQIGVGIAKGLTFRFFDIFSGSVAWNTQLTGDEVEHGQEIFRGAVAPSFAFGC